MVTRAWQDLVETFTDVGKSWLKKLVRALLGPDFITGLVCEMRLLSQALSSRARQRSKG